MGKNEILARLSELAKEYPELTINEHFLALQKDLRNTTEDEMINNYVNDILRKVKRREVVLSNDEYFKWIIDFTNRYGDYFVIEDCEDYYPELTDIDKETFKDFYPFFDGIDEYAEYNDIIPSYTALGIFYTISNDDYTFNIGIDGIGQASHGYIEKTKPNEKTIPLDAIIKDYVKVRKRVKK